jgi:hypothetical protein
MSQDQKLQSSDGSEGRCKSLCKTSELQKSNQHPTTLVHTNSESCTLKVKSRETVIRIAINTVSTELKQIEHNL